MIVPAAGGQCAYVIYLDDDKEVAVARRDVVAWDIMNPDGHWTRPLLAGQMSAFGRPLLVLIPHAGGGVEDQTGILYKDLKAAKRWFVEAVEADA